MCNRNLREKPFLHAIWNYIKMLKCANTQDFLFGVSLTTDHESLLLGSVHGKQFRAVERGT